MDFLRRLFGGQLGSDAVDESTTTAEPVADTTSETSTDVAWHKVASDAGASEYRGEVDGRHVATIVKLTDGSANGRPWAWRLEVPATGETAGHAKRLKDAKPAVASALGGRQHS